MPTKPPTFKTRSGRAPRHGARPSSCKRGYGRAWQKRRIRIYVRDNGICRGVGCGALIGSKRDWHIDHIVSRSQGGSDDDSNLQLLCASCHSKKTATEDGGFGRKPSNDKSI